MLTDELDYVLGVDTRRDEHVHGDRDGASGRGCAGAAAPANARGYRELLRVAERHAPARRAWAIEGTGSYGAGLGCYPQARGESVLEASRTPRGERRLRGKTTRRTRPGPRGPCSPATRSRSRGQASVTRRRGCCWSRGAAPPTPAAKP